VDLLDLDDFGGGAPAQPAQPAQPVQPAAPVDMLLDMGDLGSAPAPAQPAPQPILGPMQVTTAQVGAQWGQLATERRVQMQTSIGNCQEMMLRLQNGVNVSPVEIIGTEGIAAGRVLPGNEPCFLHGKLAPPRLEILIKCRDPGVAQSVADLCQRSLS